MKRITDLLVTTSFRRISAISLNAVVLSLFTSASTLAYDGPDRAGCYDYVVDGCNEKPLCTTEELHFLFDSCDAWPEDGVTPRPSLRLQAKTTSKKVVKSFKHKRKVRHLKYEIRLK